MITWKVIFYLNYLNRVHYEYSEAKKYAQLALDAAKVRHSGFRYHPDAGIVQDHTSLFMKALIKIAAA